MTVYVFVSQWGDGDRFERSVYAKAFADRDDAYAWLDNEKRQALTMLSDEYPKNKINEPEDEEVNNETHCLIEADGYSDWWEGYFEEQEI